MSSAQATSPRQAGVPSLVWLGSSLTVVHQRLCRNSACKQDMPCTFGNSLCKDGLLDIRIALGVVMVAILTASRYSSRFAVLFQHNCSTTHLPRCAQSSASNTLRIVEKFLLSSSSSKFCNLSCSSQAYVTFNCTKYRINVLSWSIDVRNS